MATTAALTENSRQGINLEILPCIGLGAWLSPETRPGCGHAYDETAVGLVVYVRNDPVNRTDPDGREWRWIWAADGFGTFQWYLPNETVTVTAYVGNDVSLVFPSLPPLFGDMNYETEADPNGASNDNIGGTCAGKSALPGSSDIDLGCLTTCIADASLNFGLGFVTGYTAVRIAIELDGIEFTPFQDGFGHSSGLVKSDPDLVGVASGTASGSAAYARASYAVLGGEARYERLSDLTTRTGFGDQLPSTRNNWTNALRQVNSLRRTVASLGTIMNILNTVDYGFELRDCYTKCKK